MIKMKKIILIMMALTGAMMFAACGDDEFEPTADNPIIGKWKLDDSGVDEHGSSYHDVTILTFNKNLSFKCTEEWNDKYYDGETDRGSYSVSGSYFVNVDESTIQIHAEGDYTWDDVIPFYIEGNVLYFGNAHTMNPGAYKRIK